VHEGGKREKKTPKSYPQNSKRNAVFGRGGSLGYEYAGARQDQDHG